MLDSNVKSINGGLDPRFNQSLDWFLNSDYYTANIPLNFLFLNEANQLESKSVPWLKGRSIAFSRGTYSAGDKVVLYYANESVLNYGNAHSEAVIDAEIDFIKSCINHYNIPLKDIILIGNLYQYNQCFSKVGKGIGLSDQQIILIDYYELQTFFFHQVLGCGCNKSFNSAAPKLLRYQYGKVSKLVRIIAMCELWQSNLLDRAVTGCLIDKDDIDSLAEDTAQEYQSWFKKQVDKETIANMLLQHHGSIDNVRYFYFKRNSPITKKEEFINHCPGYPYDHEKIFSDTKVSLVPETFFYNNQGSFLTEKIFKTIYNHHPFTILGTPGLLEVLKSRGYKTFGTLCNEMYDVCRNDRKRLIMVIDATKELIQSSNYDEIKFITEYNFAQLEKNALGSVQTLNEMITKSFA